MNLNKGCIEILTGSLSVNTKIKMNLNKGCIEISLTQLNRICFQR